MGKLSQVFSVRAEPELHILSSNPQLFIHHLISLPLLLCFATMEEEMMDRLVLIPGTFFLGVVKTMLKI